ncbi:MAG: hypothetical protein QNJ44_22820 [Rhodobacter sp.]|nr:hypothetical protein [Rhodobacter sp.]
MIKKILFASGVAMAAGAGVAQTNTAGAPTSEKLNLYVVGAPMDAVLEQVMVSFGSDSKIEGNVDQIVSSYRVQGDLREIMAGLEEAFDLVFFEFNDVFYASRAADIKTKILKIEGETPEAAMAALRLSGLPTDRFSVSSVAGSDAVIVTAPEEFIKIAEALLLAMEPKAAGNENGIVVRRGVSVSREIIN